MSIIFDNTSNNNFAVWLLKNSLHVILNKNLLDIKCACHILNLSVRPDIDMVQHVIIKIKNIIILFILQEKDFKNLSKYV